MSGATTATYVAAAAVAASAAYSAYSSIQQGKQAEMNADAQAEQARIDADTAVSAANVEASKIRKMARTQVSEARASLAGSGVMVDEGTPLNINEEITKNAEEDAVMTILNAESDRDRGLANSRNIKRGGEQARAAANSQAAGSVLSAGAQLGMAWKSSANGTASKPGGKA
ncbi:hypothetical protein [Pseudomonas sichuanensis]|uniref:hypothetical protein n=1 Tax=Pseudomonas sichuanensis TaxID=2213015 RepID=UPI000DA6A33F|nr:hypothetical protein [Pseudomonas sichuanensis]